MAYNAWSVIAGEVPTAAKWKILGSNDIQFNTDVTKLISDKIMRTANDGATITFDVSQSLLWTVTLGGAGRQLQVTGITAGKPFFIRLQQDGTGGRTVLWWTGIRFPGQSNPVLSVDPGRIDAFMFIPFADNTFDCYFAGFGI